MNFTAVHSVRVWIDGCLLMVRAVGRSCVASGLHTCMYACWHDSSSTHGFTAVNTAVTGGSVTRPNTSLPPPAPAINQVAAVSAATTLVLSAVLLITAAHTWWPPNQQPAQPARALAVFHRT